MGAGISLCEQYICTHHLSNLKVFYYLPHTTPTRQKTKKLDRVGLEPRTMKNKKHHDGFTNSLYGLWLQVYMETISEAIMDTHLRWTRIQHVTLLAR